MEHDLLRAGFRASREREHLGLQHLLPTTSEKTLEKIKGSSSDVNSCELATYCRSKTPLTHSLTATFERSGPSPAAFTAGRTMLWYRWRR